MPNDGSELGPDTISLWPSILFGMAGAGAVATRIARYTGPPRPFSAVAMDAIATLVLAFALGQAAIALTSNLHWAMVAAIFGGVMGWNTILFMLDRMAQKRFGTGINPGGKQE